MTGIEDPKTKLWKLPLSTNKNNIYETEKYKPIPPPTLKKNQVIHNSSLTF